MSDCRIDQVLRRSGSTDDIASADIASNQAPAKFGVQGDSVEAGGATMMAHMNQRNDLPRRLFRPVLTAVTLSLVVAAFFFLADQLSMSYGFRLWEQALDTIFASTIVGLLIYLYERNRSQYLNDRLKMIELMNHHVRNALNIIVTSVYVHGYEKQLNEIRVSVNRIEWALREILPGRVLDDYSETAAEKSPPYSAA